MSPNTAVNWISTEANAARAAWLTMFKERFHLYGKSYVLDWTVRPVFDLSIAALIYLGGREEMVSYVVVAMAASMFLFSTLYWVGEILDRERMKGTLVPLFLAPCSRMSWMAGYAAAGIAETLIRAAIILVAGVVLFDVRFDVNPVTLAVVLPFYVLSLSGIGLVLSGIGLLIKRSNALSNLINPFVILLGGIYVPVDELPVALHVIARALPIGYGIDAITAAALDGASLGSVQGPLLPLIGFSIVSPVIGVLAFSALDRLVRRRGEVDLY